MAGEVRRGEAHPVMARRRRCGEAGRLGEGVARGGAARRAGVRLGEVWRGRHGMGSSNRPVWSPDETSTVNQSTRLRSSDK